MPDEFDTNLPSIRQIQKLIKEASIVELKLLSGDLLTGKIIWQDRNCLCLLGGNNQQVTVWLQAIAYLKQSVN